jgi:hypothetical protein
MFTYLLMTKFNYFNIQMFKMYSYDMSIFNTLGSYLVMQMEAHLVS